MAPLGRTVILHNIISPYKTLLFNEIYALDRSVLVLYLAETESRREWQIRKSDMAFPYEVMFHEPLDEIRGSELFHTTFEYLHRFNPAQLVIDGYSYVSSWAGLVWAAINKRKVILWSSSNADDHPRRWCRELPKKLFLKGCHAFNTYGTKSREYLVGLGAPEERISMMGNTTDNDYYCEETLKWRRERHSLCRELGVLGKNFLFIGRFSAEKNIITLLSAFRRLIGSKAADWGLILVGSGPQQGAIQEYIAANRLCNVILPGFRQMEEIPRYFAVSDVLVLPSISEPWGLVVNEAMAAGLPVLVSRKCGCYPDIVREGVNGYAFNPLDEEELLCLMQGIVSAKVDPDRMGQNAREIIREYTPAKAAQVFVETLGTVGGTV